MIKKVTNAEFITKSFFFQSLWRNEASESNHEPRSTGLS